VSTDRLPGPGGDLFIDDGGLSPQSGNALPVVLVHSLAGNTAHWSAQLAHLRETRRAVALDLRGHGRSAAPQDGDYSISAMAADIGAVVNALDLRRFVLVGHSMGGGAALSYAGLHPERVAGLLLLDPIGDGTQLSASDVTGFLEGLRSGYDTMVEGYWGQISGPDAEVRKRLLTDLRATPRETVLQGFQEVMRFDPRPALDHYRGPLLSVVTPSNDQPFSLHRVGKGFPHRTVQGTGHWIQLDQPAEVNAMLDEFINSVSGTRTSVSSKRE
jgi:pimeloyl-ACP methyl ester carboxylesterase